MRKSIKKYSTKLKAMQNDIPSFQKTIIAFVGMPGSGKSEAALYLQKKGFPYVRFGQVTEEGLLALNQPLTPENEQKYREKIRKELGMAAYAIKSEEKIHKALSLNGMIIIDGLYSWEEYVFLIEKFPGLRLVYVFTEPLIRYERLAQRRERPLTSEQARNRDFSEIERLNKSGPIAMADYLIINNEGLPSLHEQIEVLLQRIQKTV